MAPVTRSKAAVLQEEVAAASSSSDEPCSSSTLAHNAAVKASRNVPLRQRKRGVAEQAIKAAWHHNQEFHSLPDYLKDNEYIQRFYRRPGLPLRKTLWSLFGIHNETGNIWSHLIGFTMFVVLTYFLYSAPPAPLSVSGHNPVHKLVMDVQHQLDSLRANLGKNMQQVQVHIPTLHALQDSLTQLADVLHHRVDNLVHTLRDDVAASASAIKEGLGALQGGVSGSLHTISDGMHTLQDNLHQQLEQLVHGGATGRLATSLPRVVQWPAPRWPVYVYMAGTMICLLASSICHLLGCCSQHVSQVVWRFDYAGIASLIVTSFYPPVYYFFMCRPWLLIGYMGSISLMGAGTLTVSLASPFQTRAWRHVRAGMFAALGSLGIVPLLHAGWLMWGERTVWQTIGLDVVMGAMYLLGALVYAMRVPERWLPGRFDLLLHSHQIFHLLIVLAALVHYKAVTILLAWRDSVGGCAVK